MSRKLKNVFYLNKVGMISYHDGTKFTASTVLSVPQHEIVNNQMFFKPKHNINKPQQIEQEKLSLVKRYRYKRNILNVTQWEDIFNNLSHVTLQNKCKGKGTLGIIRRYNAKSAPHSHGHDWQRKGRSISQGTTPGQVKKNTKMAGRVVRNVTVTKQIMKINKEENYIIVKGDVPGPKKSLVKVLVYEY